jgi:hypothetical protein
MSYIATIVGISGSERYLGKDGAVTESKQARRFRCEQSATEAAQEHIRVFPPVIQRAMRYAVMEEPK